MPRTTFKNRHSKGVKHTPRKRKRILKQTPQKRFGGSSVSNSAQEWEYKKAPFRGTQYYWEKCDSVVNGIINAIIIEQSKLAASMDNTSNFELTVDLFGQKFQLKKKTYLLIMHTILVSL